MGAKGARRSMGNLSILHPNTILKANPKPNLVLPLPLPLPLPPTLALIKTEYWDRAGGGGNISYDW